MDKPMTLRIILAALASTLIIAAPASAEEVQGWKTADEHVHTSYDLSQWQRISGPTTFHVSTLLHNNLSTVTFVRWSCESTVIQSHSTNYKGTGAKVDGPFVDTFTIQPSQCPGLYREIRVTSNLKRPNGEREFTTTRLCLQMGDSGTNYCGGPTVAGRHGGGAWYEDVSGNYLITFVDGHDVYRAQHGSFAPGDQIRVKFQGSSGHCNIDPDFHNGFAGYDLGEFPGGNTWTTVHVPLGLPAGPHKLHCRARGPVPGGPEAGAYVLPFNVS